MICSKKRNTYVIAEIGINHEGNFEVCKELILQAFNIGADAVKLQSIDPDKNYVVGSPSYRIFKNSQLSQNEHKKLFEYAASLGIDIFTTAGDYETVDWLEELDPPFWKISSGLLTHTPLIKYLARLNKPILLSTGMSDLNELDKAIKQIETEGNNKIAILQCTSVYPTPLNQINLKVIQKLKKMYKYQIGFSDHSLGDDAVFLSIAAGAEIIEKHFSFDTNRAGYDHKVSLDQRSFADMIKRIELAEMLLGDDQKSITESALVTKKNYSRFIVAEKQILHGEIFTVDNIAIKRTLPGTIGIEPERFEEILGMKSSRSYQKDEPIIN